MGLLKVSLKKHDGSCPYCGKYHYYEEANEAVMYTRVCSMVKCPATRELYMIVSDPAKCLGCCDSVGCNGKKKILV